MEIPAAVLMLDKDSGSPEHYAERLREDAYTGMSRARGALAALARAQLRGQPESRRCPEP